MPTSQSAVSRSTRIVLGEPQEYGRFVQVAPLKTLTADPQSTTSIKQEFQNIDRAVVYRMYGGRQSYEPSEQIQFNLYVNNQWMMVGGEGSVEPSAGNRGNLDGSTFLCEFIAPAGATVGVNMHQVTSATTVRGRVLFVGEVA